MRTFYATGMLLTMLFAATLFAAGVAFVTRHWVFTVVFLAAAPLVLVVYTVAVGWAKRRVSDDELAQAGRRAERMIGAIGRAQSGGWNPHRDKQPPDA